MVDSCVGLAGRVEIGIRSERVLDYLGELFHDDLEVGGGVLGALKHLEDDPHLIQPQGWSHSPRPCVQNRLIHWRGYEHLDVVQLKTWCKGVSDVDEEKERGGRERERGKAKSSGRRGRLTWMIKEEENRSRSSDALE